MPVLDQILDREQREEDTALARADRDNTWAQTFSSTPPTEVLRASRNLADLTNQALERKAQLLAQTDAKAMDIYATGKKLNEWERQAPLRDRLLEAKINSEGAATRFKELQEAKTLEQTAAFMEHMTKAPSVKDAGYQAHVLNGLKQSPRVATTQIGKEMLTDISATHEVASQLKGINTDNMEVSSVTVQLPGGGQITRRSKDSGDGSIPDSAKNKLAELNAERANVRFYLDKETDPAKKPDLEKKLGALESQIQGWKETFGGKTPEVGGAAPIAQPTQPAVAKTLDTDTARSLLSEAGGDKAKARALAKERGYSL